MHLCHREVVAHKDSNSSDKSGCENCVMVMIKLLALHLINCYASVAAVCPEGWTKNGAYRCYQRSSLKMTYDAAREKCRAQGTHLTTIANPSEEIFLNQFAESQETVVWIGLRVKKDESYVWEDGLAAEYHKVYFPKVNDTNITAVQQQNDDFQCVALFNDSWILLPCREENSFVCSGFEGAVRKPACGDGALLFQSHCYKPVRQYKTWDEARAKCQQDETLKNGDLVSILNNDLQSFLHRVFHGVFWIGLHTFGDTRRFTWLYKDEDIPYSKWGDGEPNDNGGNEGCVEIHLKHDSQLNYWNDKPCSAKLRFICQSYSDPVNNARVRRLDFDPEEASGAVSIGLISMSVCSVMIIAVVLLDLTSLRRHLRRGYYNIKYGAPQVWTSTKMRSRQIMSWLRSRAGRHPRQGLDEKSVAFQNTEPQSARVSDNGACSEGVLTKGNGEIEDLEDVFWDAGEGTSSKTD